MVKRFCPFRIFRKYDILSLLNYWKIIYFFILIFIDFAETQNRLKNPSKVTDFWIFWWNFRVFRCHIWMETNEEKKLFRPNRKYSKSFSWIKKMQNKTQMFESSEKCLFSLLFWSLKFKFWQVKLKNKSIRTVGRLFRLWLMTFLFHISKINRAKYHLILSAPMGPKSNFSNLAYNFCMLLWLIFPSITKKIYIFLII